MVITILFLILKEFFSLLQRKKSKICIFRSQWLLTFLNKWNNVSIDLHIDTFEIPNCTRPLLFSVKLTVIVKITPMGTNRKYYLINYGQNHFAVAKILIIVY